MYDYLYFYFFKYFEWRKEDDPKDAAIYGVLAVIFIHFFFIVNTVNFFLDFNLLLLFFEQGHNKYYLLPFVLVVMIIFHRIFKLRASKIIDKYGIERSVLNWSNAVIILVLTIGPLIVGIFLLNSNI